MSDSFFPNGKLLRSVCLIAVSLNTPLSFSQSTAAPPMAAQLTKPIAASAAKAQKKPGEAGGVRHIQWQELVPKGWDPAQIVKDRLRGQNINILSDADPHVIELMRQMKDVWDTAPTNPEMEGVSGRLPGYVVPLEEVAQGMKEFLLVPYYGACIHSPPPPANQIVHVFSAKPVKGFRSMDTVWVTGTIRAKHDDSYMGASGYSIQATAVERYVPMLVQPAR